MDLKCPSCQKELELFDCSVPRQQLECPACGSEFFSASDLTFRYGTRLRPSVTGMERIACPYCKQHYAIAHKLPDGLIGCQSCLRIFVVPPKDTKVFVPTPGKTDSHSTETRKVPVILPIEDSTSTAKAPGKVVRNIVPESSGTFIPNMEPAADKPSSSDKSKSKFWVSASRILGNIIWLVFGGLEFALINIFWGVVYCCTVIGIPFGLQLFKVATLQLCPFGADVYHSKDQPVGCLCTGFNIIWILFGGLWAALGNFIVGAIMCCTIIGIPFGLQYFKLGKLLFAPFGLEIRRKTSMRLTYITAAVLFLLVIPAICSILMLAFAPKVPSELPIKLDEPIAIQTEEKKPTTLIEEVTDDRGNTYIIQTPAPDSEPRAGVTKLKRKKIAAISNEIADGDGNIFIISE